MRRTWLAVAALSLMLVPACGGDDDSADAGGETTDTAGTEQSESPVTVELLDAGAEPRRELRLDPPSDCGQDVVQELDMVITVTIGPEEQTNEQGQTTSLDLRCEAVTADEIVLSSTYRAMEASSADPTVRDVSEQISGQLEGQVARSTFDRTGRLLDFEGPQLDLDDIDFGEDLGAEFDDAMGSMLDGLQSAAEQGAQPLPVEAIGVGARWRVTGRFEVAGLASTITNEYTLTNLTDDEAVATVAATIQFAEGPIEGGQLAGLAQIVEGTLQGTGTTTWQLRQVQPLVDLELEGDLIMRVGQDDDALEVRQRMVQRTSTRVR